MSIHPGINEEGGAEISVPESAPSGSFPLRLTPAAMFGSRRARRIVERNIVVYRRGWIYLVSGFFEPFFYLLSIGIGLNHLVGGIPVDGQVVAYTAFVAPGLLASSAMNGAMFDSTFNIFFKLKIAKTYDAVLSTPLGVGDIALGELSWALIRGALYSGAFLVVMAALGYVVTPWAVLCYPGAMLISFAFAAAGMAGTTYMRSWQDFSRPPSTRCRCTRAGCRWWSSAPPCTRGWPSCAASTWATSTGRWSATSPTWRPWGSSA
jgi:lipooligosaccharide transport system permease protein